MSSDRDDGFVDPTNSPRSAEPQSLGEIKVGAWKKMILQGKFSSQIQSIINDVVGSSMDTILEELRN